MKREKNKRKMVQSNLLKNSIAAYFAAIEIHNKPNIAYRYETVALLITNAWELLLKSFIRKYVKERSIFTKDGHTIPFEKSLSYVEEYINKSKPKGFTATRENLSMIEGYRNSTAHYYNEAIEPFIFMLVARAALNYVEFVKNYFLKDIIADEGLFIMPLGFKLPFRPEDFLSKKVANYHASPEAKKFINSIVTVIERLNAQEIQDSVVLGFDICLESVKKASNSDLLVAITERSEADATFAKVTSIKISNDKNAPVYNVSDNDFCEIWKHTYRELLKWCQENVENFKANTLFHEIVKDLKSDRQYSYTRRLDNNNSNSAFKVFYTDSALDKMKHEYEKRSNSE